MEKDAYLYKSFVFTPTTHTFLIVRADIFEVLQNVLGIVHSYQTSISGRNYNDGGTRRTL